ncbi:hypothetical protein HD597_000945 [Nonomuraea thailandensis]|uniref:DUF3224 domain-containing protein n=1 Tax=Nonomuraea thailandensis TaxID=1188745 RepID=A0A9X2GA21_9ACTN|nr:DUF3224 domain-containing protein [Nonomuraea thailandensis]MCP2353925.1 hypothetical protein [Nonomuraea thailandensis]
MTAKGTFETAGWTPQPPYDDRDGVTLGVVTLTKTFSGDLTGTSLVTMLIATTPVEESRSYVALERVEGTLHGRAGSFVVQHDATSDEGEQSLRIRVVADSGTGELRGIRGEMGIVIGPDGGHSYTFDYAL